MELIRNILFSFLNFLFGLVGKKLKPNYFETIFEFIKFGLVGVSNTLLSYGIYVFVWFILKKLQYFSGYDYLVAQFIAFIVGVLWSFYWNNRLVFQQTSENRNILSSLMKTFISYSFTGIILNTFLLFLWVQVFHIGELIAPLLNLCISVPLNFVLNKFWAFK